MTTKLDPIQQDIQRLPESAQDLLIDFIQILKKSMAFKKRRSRNASKLFPAWVTLRFSDMPERRYPSYRGFIFNCTFRRC